MWGIGVNGRCQFSNWRKFFWSPSLLTRVLTDLFYLTELIDLWNYTDHALIHAYDLNLEDLIKNLEHNSMLAIEWFERNYIKLNQHAV